MRYVHLHTVAVPLFLRGGFRVVRLLLVLGLLLRVERDEHLLGDLVADDDGLAPRRVFGQRCLDRGLVVAVEESVCAVSLGKRLAGRDVAVLMLREVLAVLAAVAVVADVADPRVYGL